MSAHCEILPWLADSLGPIISGLLLGHWWALKVCVCICIFSTGSNDLGPVSFHLPHRYYLVCFNPLQTPTVLSPQAWSGSFALPSLTCLASFSNRNASPNLRLIWRGRDLRYLQQLTRGLVTKALGAACQSLRKSGRNKVLAAPPR